jgi:DNA (cytosine-5)-methyltransferase 1
MKIGSLFSGYGGLDMGVMSVLGGEVAWHVEFDEAPSRILAHHWPDVPNYGDVTTVDWSTVAQVDLLTAGYPCQPFSMIGNRRGANDARHLWPNVLDAVRNLRPRIVVLENVRGHLTLGFDRVLGDLAEVGYDAQWVCIPASAAGAPHRRERIFVIARPAHSSDDGQERPGGARVRWPRLEDGHSPSADAGRVEPERRGEHRGLVGTPGSGQGADSEREWHGDAADDRGATDWG